MTGVLPAITAAAICLIAGELAVLSTSAIAQNAPSPTTVTDSTKELVNRIRQRNQSYLDVNELGSQANQRLGRALLRACIGTDERNSEIAAANVALGKVSAWRVAPDDYLETKETSESKIRKIDGLMLELSRGIEALNLKPPCPEVASPGPGATPQPIPSEPPIAQCPLTVDELQAVRSLEEDILNAQKRREVLDAESFKILEQIKELGGLKYAPFGTGNNPPPDSELSPEIRELKVRLDAIQKLDEAEFKRINEDQRRIIELKNKPPCDSKAVQLPEPPLKTALPGTDRPKARTETQTEQGKKHPKKETRKKDTIKTPRRVANRPTNANRPVAARSNPGMSPETVRTIGNIIDVGVGIGMNRMGRRGDGDHIRGDAPASVSRKISPRLSPRD